MEYIDAANRAIRELKKSCMKNMDPSTDYTKPLPGFDCMELRENAYNAISDAMTVSKSKIRDAIEIKKKLEVFENQCRAKGCPNYNIL
ncbi:MAG: hypothetical protein V1900_01905 [Candidatus Aenigmatarchaeota archaeon]